MKNRKLIVASLVSTLFLVACEPAAEKSNDSKREISESISVSEIDPILKGGAEQTINQLSATFGAPISTRGGLITPQSRQPCVEAKFDGVSVVATSNDLSFANKEFWESDPKVQCHNEQAPIGEKAIELTKADFDLTLKPYSVTLTNTNHVKLPRGIQFGDSKAKITASYDQHQHSEVSTDDTTELNYVYTSSKGPDDTPTNEIELNYELKNDALTTVTITWFNGDTAFEAP